MCEPSNGIDLFYVFQKRKIRYQWKGEQNLHFECRGAVAYSRIHTHVLFFLYLIHLYMSTYCFTHTYTLIVFNYSFIFIVSACRLATTISTYGFCIGRTIVTNAMHSCFVSRGINFIIFSASDYFTSNTKFNDI